MDRGRKSLMELIPGCRSPTLKASLWDS
jgi:hypothetical protein